MRQLKQITEVKVKANYKNRTFTIWKNGSKYRTLKFIKPEFEEKLGSTNLDWYHWLMNSDFYYCVK